MSLPLGCGGNHLCSNAPHICQGPQMTGLGKAWFFFLECVWCCPKGYVLHGHSLPGSLVKETRVCMYVYMYVRTDVHIYLFILSVLIIISIL